MMIKDKDGKLSIIGDGNFLKSITDNIDFYPAHTSFENSIRIATDSYEDSIEFIYNAYAQGFRAIDLSNEKLRLKLKESEDKRNGIND